MTEIWFTADPHLGHQLVARIRGFDDVRNHDEAVMESFSVCTKRSQLWILGDLSVSGSAYALDTLSALPCELHLISGNHDSCHPMFRNSHRQQQKYLRVFASVQSSARRRVNGREYFLSHFPYAGDHTDKDRFDVWRLRDAGGFLLHGHTHQKHALTSAREFHVGWDTHCGPVNVDTVDAWIAGNRDNDYRTGIVSDD